MIRVFLLYKVRCLRIKSNQKRFENVHLKLKRHASSDLKDHSNRTKSAPRGVSVQSSKACEESKYRRRLQVKVLLRTYQQRKSSEHDTKDNVDRARMSTLTMKMEAVVGIQFRISHNSKNTSHQKLKHQLN